VTAQLENMFFILLVSYIQDISPKHVEILHANSLLYVSSTSYIPLPFIRVNV